MTSPSHCPQKVVAAGFAAEVVVLTGVVVVVAAFVVAVVVTARVVVELAVVEVFTVVLETAPPPQAVPVTHWEYPRIQSTHVKKLVK